MPSSWETICTQGRYCGYLSLQWRKSQNLESSRILQMPIGVLLRWNFLRWMAIDREISKMRQNHRAIQSFAMVVNSPGLNATLDQLSAFHNFTYIPQISRFCSILIAKSTPHYHDGITFRYCHRPHTLTDNFLRVLFDVKSTDTYVDKPFFVMRDFYIV